MPVRRGGRRAFFLPATQARDRLSGGFSRGVFKLGEQALAQLDHIAFPKAAMSGPVTSSVDQATLSKTFIELALSPRPSAASLLRSSFSIDIANNILHYSGQSNYLGKSTYCNNFNRNIQWR